MESTNVVIDAVVEPVDETTRPAGNRFGRLLGSLQSVPGSLQKSLQRERPAAAVQINLRAWAVQAASAAGNASLKSWLEELPSKEEKSLEAAVTEFAASLHFQLPWVLDAELIKDLEVKETLSRSLLTFIEAYSLAHQVQPEFALLNAWMEWSKNPGKNLELTQQIFAILYDQQRVTISREFITMTDKERTAHMVDSILGVQQQDGSAFFNVFKLAQENASSKAPAASAPAPSAAAEAVVEAPVEPVAEITPVEAPAKKSKKASSEE